MRGPIKGFRTHVTWFVLSLAVAGGTLYALLDAAGSAPSLGGEPYRVQAVVPTAVSLAPGATVRVAGLQVGEVAGVERRNGSAVLVLELEDTYAPIPRDSRVEVRLRSVVGENYVELYPGAGGEPELESGGVLPRSQAIESVQLDQILSVLDQDTRQDARRMIRGLGRGLDGRAKELNAFFDELSGGVDAAGPILSVLARDRDQLARFIDQFGDVARAIGERGDAIRVLARQARVTAESVARSSDGFRAMLEQLPPTLVQARRTLATLQSASATTAPVLTEVAALVRELDPVIAALRPATVEGRAVLAELRGAAPRLETVLAELRRFSKPATKALPELRRALCDLNPLAEYASPYERDLGALLTSLARYNNWSDANGHAERVSALFDEGSLSVFDEETNALADSLLRSGAIGELHQKGWNPIPKPNRVAQPHAGIGAIGPSTFEEEYPRVQAECLR